MSFKHWLAGMSPPSDSSDQPNGAGRGPLPNPRHSLGGGQRMPYQILLPILLGWAIQRLRGMDARPTYRESALIPPALPTHWREA